MCGIVGYVGSNPAAPLLLQGLSRLEYRGYDSAGVALMDDSGLAVYKEAGRLALLTARLNGGEGFSQTVGIGHTRWATHGAPTVRNAHPHVSADGRWAVVHNGIIENEAVLRRELCDAGVRLRSDTDTELIAQLLERETAVDGVERIRRVTARLDGSFALGIVCADQPDTVYAVRQHSPLVLGVAEDGILLASDLPAVLPYTERYVALQEGDTARITRHGATIYDRDGACVERPVCEATGQREQAERGEYEEFMLKEIHEQPRAVEDTLTAYLRDDTVAEDVLPLTAEQAIALRRVVLVGCGSAYHAGMVGQYVIERLARIPSYAELASEFRYRQPVLDDNALVIFISQSGETADTLAALREAKRHGARIVSVVNVAESSLSNESEAVVYTRAGPEIAVATTKAYAAQLAAVYLIALRLAALRGMDGAEQHRLVHALRQLPSKIEDVLESADTIRDIADGLQAVTDVYFIGRGTDYAVAMEGALKLKEISYIHAEAYAAGELKHGTISLIEDGTVVVAVACDEALRGKTTSNIHEVRARGARVLTVGTAGTITVPATEPLFAPSLSIVPLQLLAYYTAKVRGCDVDHPRNLAKSVTVE